jgi:hypothetical protein
MTQLSSYGLPSLPSLSSYARNPYGAAHMANSLRKQNQQTDPNLELDPAVEESIAKKVGRVALGGIGAAANLLGLPGSMALDTITGHNPFDQLATPFSPENRTTGRDAGRQWGWMDKKDTWGNFFGGLGIDILTDPLTYVNPFGALTKGGSVVKAAGMLDTIPEIAAKAAQVPFGTIGKRVSGMRTTMDDVLAHATPTQLTSLQAAAAKKGINLADIASEPLRGALGLGFMGKTTNVLGTGPLSQKVAGKLDRIGETLRYGNIPGTQFSPVDKIAQLFNSKLGQQSGKVNQYFAKKQFADETAQLAKAKQPLANLTSRLVKAGWGGEDKADILRSALEETTPGPVFHSLPREVQDVVTEARTYKNTFKDAIEAEGGVVHEYTSPEVQHWPRQGLVEEVTVGSPGSGGKGAYDARNQFTQPRSPILSPYTDLAGQKYGIVDETVTIKNLAKDADIEDAIQQFRDPKEIAAIIERKYGTKIYRWFQEVPGDGKPKDRYEALANWLANIKEPAIRKEGIFANHPIRDLETYAVRGVGQASSLRSLRDKLLSKGVLFEPGTAASQVDWKTLEETLQGVEGHLQPDVFAKRMLDDIVAPMNPQQLATYKDEVAQALGQPLNTIDDAAMVKHLLSKRVSEDTAVSVGRMMRGYARPEPANQILHALDNFTNFWKNYQTGVWPAFHARNFVSGQVNNWLSGLWSLDSVKDTNTLLRGKVVENAMSIPAVQQLAATRGITNISPAAASDLLGEILYSNGMTSRFAGEGMQQAGLEGVRAPQTLSDLASEIPRVGHDAFSVKRIFRKATGMEPGTSWNPLNVRGVGNKVHSAFGPAAAGEETGAVIEGFNRMSAMIHQLKQGIEPAEAAANVLRTQAVYDAKYFTPFERETMQRLVPFWKFSKAMPVWMATELTSKPGGRLAQLLRAANRARNPDEMTPDYVAETAAIPLGSSPDGSNRYLTGAGLMAEDPLSFMGSGLRGGLLEAGSRLNPLVKTPLEWGTGQSFFQKGPMGGRQLTDMDPTIGRTLANLTGQKDAVKWPGSEGMEFLLGNSPLSRAASSLRTLTGPLRTQLDPTMKGQLGTESLKTAVNLGTGFRITNVSPAAQEGILRERVQTLMRAAGGKTFTRAFIPNEDLAKMSPEERVNAVQLQATINTLARRAKARAAARKLAEAQK